MRKESCLILSLIIFFALFLRLFHLNQLFHFTMDEALIAFRGLGLFKYNRPFLIGGISPLQIHLPPYFYYLTSVFLALSNFNPVGWGIVAALIGCLTIYFLYRLTLKISDKTTAVLASIFYTVSFTAVFFDRHFWPLTLNPLLTILSLLLLSKLNQKTFWPYLSLAGILVLVFTADPSNIPLLLTVLTFFVISWKKLKPKFSLLGLISATTVFLAPLLAFDLRHQWQNFSSITKLLTHISDRQASLQKVFDAFVLLPRTLSRFWYSPQTDIVEVHSYCFPYATARQQDLPLILVILATGILIWYLYSARKSKNQLEKNISRLILFYIFGIVLFGLLGFSIFDHYLTGLLPIFAFITAKFIQKLPQLFKITLIILFVIVNLLQIFKANNPYGLAQKQALISWSLTELQGAPFALDSISKCHRENGLRYLFELTGNPPRQSFMDSNFFWLYKEPPDLDMPGKVLLVTDKTVNIVLPILDQATFGALNAYILDNQSNLYTFSATD